MNNVTSLEASQLILVSAVKYSNPVGKRYNLDPNGQLVKLKPGARRDKATAIVREFRTPSDYFDWARSLDPNTMELSGTFSPNCDGQTVRLSKQNNLDEISATKEYLQFRGQPGVLRIDVDVKDASEVAALYPESPVRIETHSQLRGFLCSVSDVFKLAVMRITDSSSSRIFVDGKQVTGVRGLHCELVVDDARAIPQILSAIHARSWLLGYGWAFVSKGGQILERSPVDLAMDRPTQPFFGQASFLNERVESRAQETTFEGDVISSEALLESLTLSPKDQKIVGDAVTLAQSSLRQIALDIRKSLANKAAPGYADRLGISIEMAEDALIQGYGGQLPFGFELITDDGEVLTAGDLWSGNYNGVTIKYPLELDYPATTYVRYDRVGRPVLHSFAHGYHTLGVEPPPFEPPAQLVQSYKTILAEVERVTGCPRPYLFIDSPRLTQEMLRIVRSKTDKAAVYQLHQLMSGEYCVNVYTKSEYLRDILDVGSLIISHNLPDAGTSKRIVRIGAFCRWLGDERLTPRETNKISDLLKTLWHAVASALRDGIMLYLTKERQVDLMSYRVDMFVQQAVLEVERRGSMKAATLVQPHKPFDETKFADISQAVLDRVVADYKTHFSQFDELLNLIVAARFASDGRQAFFWMHAPSSFGKNFLADGVFGRGLDNRGLGIVLPINMAQIDAALKGQPSPINPDEHAGAWILFSDEFRAASGSLKEMNNTLRVAPKNRMQGELRLYMKWFTSDESVPSLSSGGVDRQLANRFSYWDLSDTARLTDRPLYNESSTTYLQAIRKYVVRVLNRVVAEYQVLGETAATDRADTLLRGFHERYQISKVFGTLDDEIPLMADEFRREIEKVVIQKYKCAIPIDTLEYRQQRELREALTLGYGAATGKELVVVLANPEVFVEAYIKRTKGVSEQVKFMARKTELIAAIGQRTANKDRICTYEIGRRGEYATDKRGRKIRQHLRGLVIRFDAILSKLD